MSVTAPQRTITVALIGNPNTGKSTLFNALSGMRQQVGNYPGCTVEKKIGKASHGEVRFTLVDLPGTYSLAPRSPDEMIAVDVLLGVHRDAPVPDVILCIVDASNLERNLYLVSQVLELGRPVVLALNMVDVASDRGLTWDLGRLREQLGLPIVEVQANRRFGLNALKAELAAAVDRPPPAAPSSFPLAFQSEVAELEARIGKSAKRPLPRFLVERLLLDSGGYVEQVVRHDVGSDMLDEVRGARLRLAAAGCPVPGIEPVSRYQWVAKVLAGAVERPRHRKITASDRLDRILTHKVSGTIVFAAVMLLVFQSIFAWAVPLMEGLEALMGLAGQGVAAVVPEGALQSLLVDGVIGGVGGVLVFLPQIVILFFFIAILEDCGYMARAAYLMDKLLSQVGLSGKSFIPLLSSFACAIPGIMATRVIENYRDRLATMLIAPLMSCSARLPVYVLLIAAFIPPTEYAAGWITLPGIVLFAMYLVGIATAVVVALVLKRTILRGETPPFVMELPSYKIPSPSVVLHRVMERGWAFVRRAGTMIFAVTIVIWAAAYYPRDVESVEGPYRRERAVLAASVAEVTRGGRLEPGQLSADDRARLADWESRLAEINNQVAGDYIRQSFLGRAGRFIEPAVRPLGWDWRIGCAVIASFPAREVVIGTLGVIYRLGEDQDESSPELREALQRATWDGTSEPVFNVPVALSIMVFFALCAQCASTLVVMRRETNSWAWPAFTFVYMTTLAYLAALGTYHAGMWLSP
jgi:ferrous iron transport protein B